VASKRRGGGVDVKEVLRHSKLHHLTLRDPNRDTVDGNKSNLLQAPRVGGYGTFGVYPCARKVGHDYGIGVGTGETRPIWP
jgi:hypothetical protein